MNWLEFVSNIVRSLAWPLTLLIAVLLLRKPLGELLPSLRKMKLRDVEFEFIRGLERAQVVTAAAIPKELQVPVGESPPQSGDRRLGAFPRGALLDAWIQVQDSAIRLVRARFPDRSVSQLNDTNHLVAALRDTGELTTEQIALFEDLRNLRNVAAHSAHLPLSDIDAIKYVASAASLRKLIVSKL